MIRHSFAASLCFSAFLVGTAFGQVPDLSGESFSRLSPGEKDFLLEYAENFDRLKEFYENITIEAHETTSASPPSEDGVFPPVPGAAPDTARSTEYIYRAREGSHFRMDVNRAHFGIIAPDESHLFGRDRVTGNHYLIGHAKNREKHLARMNSYAFQIAPIAAGPALLSWKIFPNAEGKVIEYVDVDHDESGEEVVSISITTGFESGPHDTYQLYRNRSWALKEAREQFGEDGQFVNHYRCAYDGESDGFPLLREYEFTSTYRDTETGDRAVGKHQVFAITAITPGAPDASHFDARQILNEIGGLGEKTSGSNLNLLLVINGVLLALLGLYLSGRVARKRRQTSSS